MRERELLEQAIVALEAQRAILGDAVVDTALAPMREKLAALRVRGKSTAQQRKQVTILFADISGYTALSEMLDAEDLSDTMNALWQRIDAVITAHGGVIDKHIGDEVMALWGVGQAREDDPERAIYAALAMQVELAAFRQARDVQLAMRVGLNTGPVLWGEVRTGEFTAIGNMVNLASRMEHAAPVGGILITHDTYRHVRGIFDVLPQEPLKVKGKAELVQTYVVQRAKLRAFRVTTRGIEGIETRMVGRDAELLFLQNTFHEVRKDSETRVVTVVGEAGVGKSRLLYEFDNWIELLPDAIYYFRGRASSAMQNASYSIIRDMFTYRFEILESDSAATVLAKFRAGMAGILDADRAALVGHLIGFDFSASQAVQNLLNNPSFGQLARVYLINYLRALANRQPLVLFLEDIHWADASSLTLVDYLVTAIPAAPLMVVCLARPLLFERRPHWGAGRGAYTRLDLKPLSKRTSRVLVGEILQKVERVPDVLRDLVVERAEGNPFYVEELIKILIEDGVIVRGEEWWRVELERLLEMHVPSTLTGVLQARLDSLPREEKILLQRAAVVGRRFWNAAVAELVADEAEAAQIDGLLNAVRSRELVFRQDHSAFAGTDEYIFKHAILHDVTYETVLLKLRRLYHAQVARWLEVNAGERLSEYLRLIAGHYELAGERARAVEYLRRSGEEAHQVSAYHDAVSAFERALSLLPEDELASRAMLLVELGSAYRQASDYPLAIEYLEEGLALSRETGNPQTEVAALNRLGWTVMGQGAYVEALRHLEQALTLAREIDDREGIAMALYNLGDVAYRRGESVEAGRCAKESLAICRELGDHQGMAFALRVLGFAAYLRGEYAAAICYHRESQTVYREIGDRWGVATCLINLGEVARKQRKYEGAARYYEESLLIFREIDHPMGVAIALLNLGHVHVGMGQDATAWKYLRESLNESVAIQADQITLESLLEVARLQVQAVQYAPAAELLGLVQSHPAFNAEIGEFVDPILTTLREMLSASELAAALARGRVLELEQVVVEILEKGTV